jgi:hypothetical protein
LDWIRDKYRTLTEFIDDDDDIQLCDLYPGGILRGGEKPAVGGETIARLFGLDKKEERDPKAEPLLAVIDQKEEGKENSVKPPIVDLSVINPTVEGVNEEPKKGEPRENC